MVVLAAYFLVILIWATTPLTIQWSSESLSFIAAVLLRMSLALFIGLTINKLLRRKLFTQKGAWKVYAAGALGIFPNMPVIYWSEQFIPSGLVAVVFAMSPFAMGLMTMVVLKHNPFNVRRVFALTLALMGLLIIFYQQLQLNLQAAYGVAGMLLSCFLFSLSSVLVKKLNVKTDAFNQALGALLFSLPGLLLLWWLLDGQLPSVISIKSLLAVSYLAIFASLLGAALFFYVLGHMSPTAVSLITFITPILALLLGAWAAGESLSAQLWAGVSLVIIALLFYVEFSTKNIFYSALRKNAWRDDSFQTVKNSFHRYK